MSIFGRRPNPEQIATQLIEGLENGTLTLGELTTADNASREASFAPTAAGAETETPTKAEVEESALILDVVPIAVGPFLQFLPTTVGTTRTRKRRKSGGTVRVSGLLVDSESTGAVPGYAPV